MKGIPKTITKLIFSISLLLITLVSHSQCCDYTLVMNDSYGDGWNGATLEVFVNGISVGIFAAEEEGSNEIFNTCNDDTITLEYLPGIYENENTYFLLGSGGNIVFSDGPEPEVGELGPFITDCDAEPAPGVIPCSAISLDIDDCYDIDNTGVIGTGYVPDCSNYQGGDLWYQIVVPESGNLVFQTFENGGINDTGIQLWTGPDCLDIDDFQCDDDSGDGYLSFMPVNGLDPGDVVYLQVWGYGGAAGSFELCISDPGTVELTESFLPLFLIDTNDEEIPDEPKIDATLQVIYNGPGMVNSITDAPNDYNGVIGIEIRGATSANYPQKPYGFETRDALGENNNVSLIDLPQENDWILLSNYNDKTFMRNLLANHLFEKMGGYSPRVKLCEVILNDDYQGIYAFTEKIKVDDNRVDIAKLTELENDGDDVTGGYILELNYWNNDNSWELEYSPLDHPDYDVHLVYKYPKAENITEPQKEYIAAYVDSMETAIYSADFMDPDEGYRKYLDIESFIDYFLINEVSRNNDGFKKSRYFHKDKTSNGGLFKAGPTWDFDWGWKDMYSCEQFENQDGSGWAHLINTCPTDNYCPDWYIRMQQDSTYNNHLRCRWDEYREDFLNEEYIHHFVDSVASLVSDAQLRHYQKWPIIGVGTDSPEIEPLPDSYQGEVDHLKNWISLRLNWLDDNLLGTCWSPIIGVEEKEIEVSVYPNPNQGDFVIECEGCVGKHMQLRNMLGQIVWKDVAISDKTNVFLNDFSGVLTLTIDGVTSEKIVVRK